MAMAHGNIYYDNHKRALVFRDELSRLRKILADIVDREEKKEKLLSMDSTQQGIRIPSSVLAQNDNIVKHVFCSDSE